MPTQQEHGPQHIIDQLVEATQAIVDAASIDPALLLGIGIAAPGPLDHIEGIIYEPPNMTDWKEVPLKALVAARVGYPVVVDNDATAAAVGEHWSGGAKAAPNFAFVYIGQGVGMGAGLFIDNRVYRGSTTNAGEFGHINVDPAGPPCSCGGNGCLEVVCNTNALVAAVYRELETTHTSSLKAYAATGQMTYKDVYRAALLGDELALRCVQQMARTLGRAVVSMVNLLDVELVVLGGKALREIGLIYQQEVQQVLNNTMVARKRRRVHVALSQVGEDAAAVGAAALVLYEFYTPQLLGL
jgi:glucokinase-like ROK family protein